MQNQTGEKGGKRMARLVTMLFFMYKKNDGNFVIFNIKTI